MLCKRLMYTFMLFISGILSFSAYGTVILQYHHVSETTPASTSVTPAQFEEQMAYIAANEFNVIPLTQLIDALKNGRTLPEKSLVITFDDGYNSIAEVAHPILIKYGFPYTLFVSIEPIEKRYSEMMSWQQLKVLAKEGADIANHSWGHEHLIHKLEGESEQKWLSRIEANILKTEQVIKEATGQSHKLLAYPYGEYNTQLEKMLQRHGYSALGQQSGAAGKYSSLTALPRFPVAGSYANLDDLKVKMNSLSMPVLNMTPANPELSHGQWQPKLIVTLDMRDINSSQVNCFVQGQGAQTPTWLSEDTFSVQAVKALPAGRSRYNCTAPSKTRSGYYWFSQAWVRPRDDGSWIKG